MGPKDTIDYSVLVIQRTHFKTFFIKKQEKTTVLVVFYID